MYFEALKSVTTSDARNGNAQYEQVLNLPLHICWPQIDSFTDTVESIRYQKKQGLVEWLQKPKMSKVSLTLLEIATISNKSNFFLF